MAEPNQRESVVLDRLAGVCGELVLRRVGAHAEIIANGTFLMDTRNGTSERLLVRAALDRLAPAAQDGGARVLVGGLGVGFSLRAALDHPGVGPGGTVVVVEREAAVIEWNHGPLRDVHGDALADPRVRCVHADLVTWLPARVAEFDAICLDVDNGPDWTVTDGNAMLYGGGGLGMLAGALAPGGVLAVWSASASPEFQRRLRAGFTIVDTIEIPVPRGEPDVVFLAAAPAPG